MEPEFDLDVRQPYRDAYIGFGTVTLTVKNPPDNGALLLAALGGGVHTVWSIEWDENPGQIKWIGSMRADTYTFNLYGKDRRLPRQLLQEGFEIYPKGTTRGGVLLYADGKQVEKEISE